MKKKKKIITSSILILIAFAVIGGFVYSLLPEQIPPNSPYLVGNTAGNLHNGGLFCEADGKVYFSNSYENGNLYSMNADETEIKKINDLSVFSINSGGDFLYFLQGTTRFSGDGFGIYRSNPGLYRSKANGRDLAVLKSGNILTATLGGNDIFYQDSDPLSLYRIGIDGENDRRLSTEATNPSSFANGVIYYSRTQDDHDVYTLDVQSGFSTLVFHANTYNAIYLDGYIYFMDLDNNYRLCRYSIFDNVIEVLTSDRVDFYNVGNGVIFYQKNSRSEPALIRMGIDGSGAEIVREGNHNSINMTSLYVYYRAFGDDVTIFRTPLYGPPSVSTFRP
ncbi:MAG: DUF5050 domain-containing protein [Lachnospiraceae bacterium]|nr:DUF5050 domain-containing protein [Lachnospiraceae bacterium]